MQNFSNQNANYGAPTTIPAPNNYHMPMQNFGNANQITNMPPYVNGIESARNYGMPANSTVFLMDSTQDVFYKKTTDASGFPTLKAYKFSEIPITTQDIASNVADTLQQVIAQMAKMEEKLNELTVKQQPDQS